MCIYIYMYTSIYTYILYFWIVEWRWQIASLPIWFKCRCKNRKGTLNSHLMLQVFLCLFVCCWHSRRKRYSRERDREGEALPEVDAHEGHEGDAVDGGRGPGDPRHRNRFQLVFILLLRHTLWATGAAPKSPWVYIKYWIIKYLRNNSIYIYIYYYL